MNVNSSIGLSIIDELKKMDGAIDYDGDCSCQVVFKLANGKTLRFYVTDDDVAEVKGLRIDQYEGLPIRRPDGTPTTDLHLDVSEQCNHEECKWTKIPGLHNGYCYIKSYYETHIEK